MYLYGEEESNFFRSAFLKFFYVINEGHVQNLLKKDLFVVNTIELHIPSNK